MTAKAILICRQNSHPFQERSLALDQSIKVGRSVARVRASPNNAIFDCKVLSRNHALIWYESGKFYLQDTKSSNGTFVNNQRLSKGSEESSPREVYSGDILQFGVDVMENSRKVTHGCIIATLKLYLPDGKEAKASPTLLTSSGQSIQSNQRLSHHDIYTLHLLLQEALTREQLLENKLGTLQRLVWETQQQAGESWKSMIGEDRLLTRIEILESQLVIYTKNINGDKLKEELKNLFDEKEKYQNSAKENIRTVLEEKIDACNKLQLSEKSLSNTEDELSSLKELYDKNLADTQDLISDFIKVKAQLEDEVNKKADLEKQHSEQIETYKSELTDIKNQLEKEKQNDKVENNEVENSNSDLMTNVAVIEIENESNKILNEIKTDDLLNDNDFVTSKEKQEDEKNELNKETIIENLSDHLDIKQTEIISKNEVSADVENDLNSTCVEEDSIINNGNYNTLKHVGLPDDNMLLSNAASQEIENLKLKLSNSEMSAEKLSEILDSERKEKLDIQNAIDSVNCQLESLKNELKDSKLSYEAIQRKLEEKAKETEELRSSIEFSCEESKILHKNLKDAELEKVELRSQLELHQNHKALDPEKRSVEVECLLDVSDVSSNRDYSSEIDETKLQLHLLKEKFAECSHQKSIIQRKLDEQSEEYQVLLIHSRTTTACCIIPIVVLIVAIFLAFHSSFSFYLGTADA